MNKLNRGSMINLRGILYDVIANLVVFVLCYYIFIGLLNKSVTTSNTVITCCIYIFIYVLLGLSGKMYDLSTFYYNDRIVRRVLLGCLTATTVVTFVFYFSGRAITNRDFYAVYFILCVIAHLISAFLSSYQNRRVNGAKKTLLVGTKADFVNLTRFISKTNLSFAPIGYVKLEHEGTPDESTDDYLGYVCDGDLEYLVRESVVDQVYIMKKPGNGDAVQRCIDICVDLGVVTRMVMPLSRNDCSTHIGCIGTYPVVSYHLNSLNPAMLSLKRVVDIIGSCIGIIVSSPILLVSAIAIKLDSPGPVFFKQTRVGQNGRRFQIIKLRTMGVDAEARKQELLAYNEVCGGLMFKIKADPRITRVGSVLRKTSIDEIPQFFNVLSGKMSLVGTRPPTEDEVKQYESQHWRRLRIKPGITGLWQISGRSTINDFDEIVALDTQYIENWTIITDFRILLRTVSVVLKRKGAS